MSTSLIVPFRPDGKERDRNWKWLEAYYRRVFPEWEISVGLHEEGPWCKGKAVRDALSRSSGEKLIVSDADMVLSDEVLREGLRALDDHPWVVPHRRAYRLTEAASVALMAGQLAFEDLTHDDLEMPPRHMYPCGGVFFVRREVYLESGGFDERFTNWGGEDESLGIKLGTLYGPPPCLESVLVHLYHRPQSEMPEDRRRPERVQPLVAEYEAAQGNPDEMRAIG